MRYLLFILLIVTIDSSLKAQGGVESSMTISGFYGFGNARNSMIGLNASCDINKQNRYAFGIGSGIEKQSTDTFIVYAVPLYFNFQFKLLTRHLEKQSIFGFIRPGMSFAYYAASKFSIDTAYVPGMVSKQSNNPNDFLKADIYFIAGIGYQAESGFRLEFFYRNQPTNFYSPYLNRNVYLGISMGYRIL